MQANKKNKSALQEIKGVKQPTVINPLLKTKVIKSKNIAAKTFITEILKGNITYLSKAITLVESTNSKHQKKANKIIDACLLHTNNSIRIGITGVPGVGKSTFIETFGELLTKQGNKIAVLAIDPSSSINKGSILGDKTRMEALVKNDNAYIRPSPSGESLGGVAKKTRETIMLCEAAGFNIILIETVGVGQSETAVHKMVDFFLLLKLAGSGDELQGIKRGIIEMADIIVINKADNDNLNNAKLAKRAFENALHLYPIKKSNWQPKVTTCSAINNIGILDIWNIITDYMTVTKKNQYFKEHRIKQQEFWLKDTIKNALQTNFNTNSKVKKILAKELLLLKQQQSNPFNIAERLLKAYFKK